MEQRAKELVQRDDALKKNLFLTHRGSNTIPSREIRVFSLKFFTFKEEHRGY